GKFLRSSSSRIPAATISRKNRSIPAIFDLPATGSIPPAKPNSRDCVSPFPPLFLFLLFLMVDPLPILPFTKPAAASVRLPGSKSITNRTLILAALGEGETLLEGALFSEDTEIMATALQSLGFFVETDRAAETIRIRGEGGKIPNRSAKIHVGNAGTAARFLTAFCCLAEEGDFQLDGVPQMRKRPMKGLIDALTGLGAR